MLFRSRSGLSAATFYGRDPGSDERPLASIAAQAAGCRHVELPLQYEIDLDSWSEAAPSPRPGHYSTMAQQRRLAELAHELGASAVVTGDGGDAVFYQPAGVEVAADFVHEQGLKLSAARVIMATAMLTETSVWVVTREALKGLKWRRRRHVNILADGAKHRKLASADARELFARNFDRYAPSYLPEAMELPVGKFAHVCNAAQAVPCGSVLAGWDDPTYINPYTDEVVKEFCLATPVYIHCREGLARWLPRVAFAGVVPGSLLQRVTKGRPEAHFHAVADGHLPQLSERLLAGELVKRGILDRKAVTSALRGHTVKAHGWELLNAFALEVWLEVVRGASQRTMAA